MADEKPQEAIQKQEKFAVTEQDIRKLCDKWDIDLPIIKAAHKNLARGNPNVDLYEVLYLMGQAKMMGLPVLGNWFTLISTSQKIGDKWVNGTSPCMKLDAALFICANHKDVDQEEGEHHSWTGGDGTVYEEDNPPYFKKARETDILPVIDWDLTCTVTVKMKSGKVKKRTMRYRDVARQTDKSDGPWLKNPSHMLWKQTAKEFVRLHFGGGLIWEDEDAIDVTPAPAQAPKLDPGQAIPTIPVRTVDAPVSPNQTIIGEAETQRLRKCCQSLGIPLETMIAGLREFTGRGGTVEQFLTETEKSCASPAQPEPEPPGIIHTEEDEPQEGPEPPIEDMQQAQDEAPEPDRDAYAGL